MLKLDSTYWILVYAPSPEKIIKNLLETEADLL